MKTLEKTYGELHGRICGLDSNCLDNDLKNMPMRNVLRRFMVENGAEGADLLETLNALSKESLQNGVMLHDLSGIGLYTLAYRLAFNWSLQPAGAGTRLLFPSFKYLIVLPIEHINFHRDLEPNSIEDFLKIWLPGVNDNDVSANDILVIVSGCSKQLRCTGLSSERNQHLEKQVRWLAAIKHLNLSHVVISNTDTHEQIATNETIRISLRPLNFAIGHPERDVNTPYYISGKKMLQRGKQALESCFVQDSNQASVKTFPNWHTETLMNNRYADIKMLPPRQDVRVAHEVAEFRPQQIILELLSLFNSSSSSAVQSQRLTTPSEWFCAATTAAAYRKSIASYFIGDRVVLRNLVNNYMVELKPTQPSVTSIFPKQKLADKLEIVTILTEVSEHPDFQNMTCDQLKDTMNATCVRLKREGKGNFAKATNKLLAEISNFILGDNKDKLGENFSRDNILDVSYHKIAAQVAQSSTDTHPPAPIGLVREILRGNAANQSSLILGIAATTIAETSRYPITFLAVLCLLDLIELDNDRANLWKEYFASSQYQTFDDTSLENLILGDIIHTVGGLHPMSHGNSYNQVTECANLDMAGMHWCDFKIHAILMVWMKHLFAHDYVRFPYLRADLTHDKVNSDSLFTDDPMGEENLQAMPYAHQPQILDAFFRRLQKEDFSNMAGKFSPPAYLFFREMETLHDILDFIQRVSEEQQIVRIPPQRYGKYTDKAYYFTMLGHLHEGCRALQLNLEISGWRKNSIDELVVEELHNQFEMARKHFATVLKIEPRLDEAYLFFACTYIFPGSEFNAELALSYINRYLQIVDRNKIDLYSFALIIKAQICYLANDYLAFEKTYSALQKCVVQPSQTQNMPRIHAMRGILLYQNNGDRKLVRKELKQFLDSSRHEEDQIYSEVLRVRDACEKRVSSRR